MNMEAAFVLTKNGDESWHDCAVRHAKKFGLQFEVAKDFDTLVKQGNTEEDAAVTACMNWDVCELKSGGAGKPHLDAVAYCERIEAILAQQQIAMENILRILQNTAAGKPPGEGLK
jgi:hypothetical protein